MSHTAQLIWLQDCSGSLQINKAVEQVNRGLQKAWQLLEKEPPVFVSLGSFNQTANWEFEDKTPTDILAKWLDLKAQGETTLGKMLDMCLSKLKNASAQPTAVILASDGMPTDDFESDFTQFKAYCQKQNIHCYALAIGQDAEPELLERFSNKVFYASKTEQIQEQIVKLVAHSLKDLQASPAKEKVSSLAKMIPPNPSQPQKSQSPKSQSPKKEEPTIILSGKPDKASKPDDAAAQFLTDYQALDATAFVSKYQSEKTLLTLAIANQKEAIRGTESIFEEKSHAYSLFAYHPTGQDRNLTAVPVRTMNYTRKMYQQSGLKDFFETDNPVPEQGRFTLELLEACKIQRYGKQWKCTEKGRIRFAKR